MKITIDYTTISAETIEIQSAKYIGDYAIRIIFNDNSSKLLDFKPFLFSSLHPAIRKYISESKFKKFKIIDGNLNWNDYEMIFPLAHLYRGEI